MNTADAKDNNYGDLMHEISEEMRQLAHVKARKSESKLLKNQQLLVGYHGGIFNVLPTG